jgi:hypothetical protein
MKYDITDRTYVKRYAIGMFNAVVLVTIGLFAALVAISLI